MLNQELVNKIASLNIVDYGVYNNTLESLILEKKEASTLVIALNNIDTDGVALKLFDNKSEEIFKGAQYLANAINVKNIILFIPEYAKDLAKRVEKTASIYNISIEIGIVNRRRFINDLICHIVTVLELEEALTNTREEGIYVSVDNKEFKKINANTTLCSLVKDVKGVRTSNTIRNTSELDLTVGEANLTNGCIQSIYNSTCVVSLVEEKLLADRKQSCGKCVFCREGLLQIEQMTKDMTVGRGKLEFIDLSNEIGEAMTYSTPCSMGQLSSTLLLSALKAFKEEFEIHIKKKKCPADACIAFRKVYIDPVSCIGCGECMKVCPTDSIDGAEGYIHIVFDNTCTKCEKCVGACKNKSIHVTTDSVPRLPSKMMRIGRFKNI